MNVPNPLILSDSSPLVKKLRRIFAVPSLLGVFAITVMATQEKFRSKV